MKELDNIKRIINEHKQELTRKYKVRSMAVFGSYARSQQSKESDIDILVEFKESVGLLHLVSLENYLTDILNIKADLVPKDNIREELKDIILKEAIYI